MTSSAPEAATTAGNGSGTDNAGQGGAYGSRSGKVTDSGNPGQYVDYSPDLVTSTPGTKLLFFHAPWCSQCQALESDIEANTIPDDVTIFKVDYDTNQDLRQKYGVTIQTTMVEGRRQRGKDRRTRGLRRADLRFGEAGPDSVTRTK